MARRGRFRDPDAHRRELLTHQRHLALGIAGEIRTRLVLYRSKQETSEDYYPRIESIRDNYGNIWTSESNYTGVKTNILLRPGDEIEIVITGSDPLGEDIEYGYLCGHAGFCIMPQDTFWQDSFWQKENSFKIRISEENIGDNFHIVFYIRSLRKYHANKDYDDSIVFYYNVLPPKFN